MKEGKRRTRVVWKSDERQAIVEAAVDIDPFGHGHRLEIFRRAQDEAIRRGKLSAERRRKVSGLGGDQMAWYPEKFVAEKERRARAAADVAENAPPSPPEPLPEPAPAEAPPAAPAAVEPIEAYFQAPPATPAAQAAPEPDQIPPHLLRKGLIGRPDLDALPPPIQALMGGLDALPLNDLLATLGRRFLGLAGPEDPSLKQRVQSIALLLTGLDQQVQSMAPLLTGLDQRIHALEERANTAHLKLGGHDVQVRVVPEPKPKPQAHPKPEPPKPQPEPKPEPVPVKPEPVPEPKPTRPRVVFVITHSGNVDNHIRKVCGKLADLVFLDKLPTLSYLKQFVAQPGSIIAITKWCNKAFTEEIKNTFTENQYVEIPGNADSIAEQLKIGLMDMMEAGV